MYWTGQSAKKSRGPEGPRSEKLGHLSPATRTPTRLLRVAGCQAALVVEVFAEDTVTSNGAPDSRLIQLGRVHADNAARNGLDHVLVIEAE